MTKKLPPADDWQARDIDDWNTSTYHAYLVDKHREMFGVDYVPFRGWQAEKGMIGNLIGTRTKPAMASKADVKRFIDEAMREYRPTPQYPGTSFGWLWTYRKNVWQRIQAESARRERIQQANESVDWDELADWL